MYPNEMNNNEQINSEYEILSKFYNLQDYFKTY